MDAKTVKFTRTLISLAHLVRAMTNIVPFLHFGEVGE